MTKAPYIPICFLSYFLIKYTLQGKSTYAFLITWGIFGVLIKDLNEAAPTVIVHTLNFKLWPSQEVNNISWILIFFARIAGASFAISSH